MQALTENIITFNPPEAGTVLNYLCRAKSVFTNGGKIINETVIHSIINVFFERVTAEGYVVWIKTEDTQQEMARDPQSPVGKMNAFIRKLSVLMNEVQLLLGFDGAVKRMLNKDEIKDQWEVFKKTTVKDFDFNPRLEKEMIEKWEAEFARVDDKCRTGLPYSLFFNSFYGEKRIFGGVYNTTEAGAPSKLFYDVNLLGVKREKITVPAENIVKAGYEFEMSDFDQPKEEIKRKIKYIFNTDVSAGVPYQYRQVMNYTFNLTGGWIINANGFIAEELNNEISFQQQVEVSLIGK